MCLTQPFFVLNVLICRKSQGLVSKLTSVLCRPGTFIFDQLLLEVLVTQWVISQPFFYYKIMTNWVKVITSINAVIVHWGMFTKFKYSWNADAAWLVALNFNNATQKQLHLFPKQVHTFPFSNLTTTQTSKFLMWIPQTHGKYFSIMRTFSNIKVLWYRGSVYHPRQTHDSIITRWLCQNNVAISF